MTTAGDVHRRILSPTPGVTDLVVDREGVRLAVRDYGGQGAPALLLHGAGRNLEDFALLADRLVAHRRVVAIDLRGHGHSDDGDWSLQACLADIEAVIDQLDLGQPLLIGHSLGGVLAVLFAARSDRTVHGVVNIDGYTSAKPHEFDGLHANEATAQLTDLQHRERTQQDSTGARLTDGQLQDELTMLTQTAVAMDVNPGLLHAVARRGLSRDDHGTWHQRPTPRCRQRVATDLRDLDLLDIYTKSHCDTLVYVTGSTPPSPGQDDDVQKLRAAHHRWLVRTLRTLAEQQPNLNVELLPTSHEWALQQAADRLAADTVRRMRPA